MTNDSRIFGSAAEEQHLGQSTSPDFPAPDALPSYLPDSPAEAAAATTPETADPVPRHHHPQPALTSPPASPLNVQDEEPETAASYLQAELDKALDEVVRLRREKEHLQHQVSLERSRADRKCKAWHDRAAKRRDDEHANVVAELRASYQRLIDEQQEQINRYGAELREAQATTFAEMARPARLLEEDSTLKDDLQHLHNNLWSWARTHGLPSLDALHVGTSDVASLTTSLAEAGVDVDWVDLKGPATVKKLPALLLAALVTNHVYGVLFEDPFFFIDSIDFNTPTSKRLALRETLTLLNRYDPYEAMLWRTQLLRTVYPFISPASSSETSKGIIQATEDSMWPVCNMLAHSFLSGPAGLLLVDDLPDKQKDQVFQQLLQCYLQAGKLFTRMHSQPLALGRQQGSHLNAPYDAQVMRLHRLYGKYDQGDDQLAGKRVTVVVSPSLHKTVWRDGTAYGYLLVQPVVCVDI